jgi:hypothetical protein
LKVASGVFGRTNQMFPAKWLRLVSPDSRENSIRELAKAAEATGTVIDISSSPALWGGFLRGTNATIMGIGPNSLADAIDEQQSHDLVLAHLIETLSGIGRDCLDFYFLQVDRPLKEFQINGALIALEEARQEQNVKFVGIAARHAFASLGVIHLHDAFEAVLIYESAGSVQPLRLLAQSRRMAIITLSDEPTVNTKDGEASLILVSEADQVKALVKEIALA